jgi:hypothetical protein
MRSERNPKALVYLGVCDAWNRNVVLPGVEPVTRCRTRLRCHEGDQARRVGRGCENLARSRVWLIPQGGGSQLGIPSVWQGWLQISGVMVRCCTR